MTGGGKKGGLIVFRRKNELEDSPQEREVLKWEEKGFHGETERRYEKKDTFKPLWAAAEKRGSGKGSSSIPFGQGEREADKYSLRQLTLLRKALIVRLLLHRGKKTGEIPKKSYPVFP